MAAAIAAWHRRTRRRRAPGRPPRRPAPRPPPRRRPGPGRRAPDPRRGGQSHPGRSSRASSNAAMAARASGETRSRATPVEHAAALAGWRRRPTGPPRPAGGRTPSLRSPGPSASVPQRSPAPTTATGPRGSEPPPVGHRARRCAGSPARTGGLRRMRRAPRRPASDPLGDGSTSRVPGAEACRSAGESDQRAPPARVRPGTGQQPLCCAAKVAAPSSAHGYGSTVAPRPTATDTAVVNRSTSTMTTPAAPGPSRASPFGPHSKWRSNDVRGAVTSSW